MKIMKNKKISNRHFNNVKCYNGDGVIKISCLRSERNSISILLTFFCLIVQISGQIDDQMYVADYLRQLPLTIENHPYPMNDVIYESQDTQYFQPDFFPTQSDTTEVHDNNQDLLFSTMKEVIGSHLSLITFVPPGKQLNHSIQYPDKFKFIESHSNEIYYLDGNKILRIRLEQDGVDFTPITSFDDITENIVSVQITNWSDILILLVRVSDQYNVYVKTSSTNLMKVQSILFPNRRILTSRMFVIHGQVYLLIATKLNKAVGKITLYKWQDSHFVKEQELETFVVDGIHVYHSEDKVLLLTVMHGLQTNSKTKANLYHVANGQLHQLQHIFFGVDVIHPFSFKNMHYILACHTKNACFIYHFYNNKFSKIHQIDQVFTKTTQVVSDNDVISVVLDNAISFYLNPELNNPVIENIPLNFLNKYLFLQFPNSEQKYLVLLYVYPTHLNVRMIEMHVNHETEQVSSKVEDQGEVDRLFNELRILLENRGDAIQQINEIVNTVIRVDKPVKIEQPLKVVNQVHVTGGLIRNLNVHSEKLMMTPSELLEEIALLNTNVEALHHHITNRGPSKTLNKREINDSGSRIHKAKKLVVKNLHYLGPEFQNLLLKSQDNIITAPVNVQKLVTKELKVTSNIINDINLDEVVVKNTTEKIRGHKAFNYIKANTLKTDMINNFRLKYKTPAPRFRNQGAENDFLVLNEGVSAKNLKINNVNSLPWTNIENSLEVKSKKHIHGNLYLKRPSLITKLNVETINGIHIQDLFTKNTDQTVESSIWINNFLTSNLRTGTINGMNFKEMVVLPGQENHIKSHVVMSTMNVTGALTLSEEDVSSGRHIIGTRPEDLLQLYSGDVVIKGSLTLKNVKTDSEITEILVNDRPFTTDFEYDYWVNHVNQDISEFKFLSAVTTSQLQADEINYHPASNYLMTYSMPYHDTPFMKLLFKRCDVLGNVISHSQIATKISEIDKSCIRRGTAAVITGNLKFTGELSTNALTTSSINGQIVENFAQKSASSYLFKGKKHIKNLEVHGPLYAPGQLHVYTFNGTDLIHFFSHAATLNDALRLDSVSFNDLKITNLTVNTVQSVRFDQFLNSMYSVLNNSASVPNIRISEHAFFEHQLTVGTINGVNIDEYFQYLVRKDRSAVIKGSKKFGAGLTIKQNVWAPSINGYDLGYWQTYALTATDNQVITGNWKIKNLITDHLQVEYIDDILAYDLLNAQAPVLNIYSDVKADEVFVQHNCAGNLLYDINSILYGLEYPNIKNYQTLIVDGPVQYPMHFKSKLTDLLMNAVTADAHQTIHGKVEFVNRPYILDAIIGSELINDINIFSLHADALKYASDKTQIVYARKKFVDPIHTKFSVIKYKLDAPLVNEIDVVKLNNTIYRKNQPLNYFEAKKIFRKPPIIGELGINGLVNGVAISDVAFAKDEADIPYAHIHNLQVLNNMLVNNINNISLDGLLVNRVRLYGPEQEIYGTITFQTLHIVGGNYIPYINDVDTKSLVYLKWPTTQIIQGTKTINDVLNLNGPVHCSRINGYDLEEIINENVQLDTIEYLKQLRAKNLIVENGLIVTDTINDRPIENVLHVQPKNVQNMLPIVSHMKELVQSTSEMVQGKKSSRLLYLEPARDVEIIFQDKDLESSESVRTNIIIDSFEDCHEQMQVQVLNSGKIYVQKHKHLYRSHYKLRSGMMLETQSGIQDCDYVKTVDIILNGNKRSYQVSGKPLAPLTFADLETPSIGILSVNDGRKTTFDLIYLNKGNDWSIKQVLDVNEGNNAKILTLDNHVIAIITTKTAAEIYVYHHEVDKFVEEEKVPGHFDLISDLIIVEDEKMIALGHKNTKTISIYKFENMDIQFFQTLPFTQMVKTIKVFKISGKSYLAVIMTDGHFYIYRYNHIDGWTSLNYSFFEELESLVVFESLGNEYLLVVSRDSASAIRVYYQS